MSLADELEFARPVVAEANSLLYEGFHSQEPLIVINKGDGTKVTDLDQLISDAVTEACRRHGKELLSEEQGSTAVHGQDDIFILDPVDGTHNLINAKQSALGASVAGVSLGLWRQGPALGVVGFPLLGYFWQTYMAYRGGGAWRESGGQLSYLEVNAEPTRGVVFVTTAETQGAQRLINILQYMGFTPYRVDGAVFKACALVDPELPRMYRLPTFHLPEGPIVGFVSRGVHLHDIAAVTCIVREAGGIATEPVNAPGKQIYVAANNQEVYDLLFDVARSV